MSFRSVRIFRVESGQAEAFERAYRDGAFLERAVTNPGFIRGELVRAQVDPPVFVALAEWETEADYAAWQAAYDQLPAEPTERRWYTFPSMTRDEVVMFRAFDSDLVDRGEPFWTPHSAFRDPTAGDDAPPRASIEMRAICLFLG